MKIAIVGSRNWQDAQAVRAYVDSLPPETVIISGGAQGVDRYAEISAFARGMQVEVFKPDWKRYGNSAGVLRNVQIIEAAESVTAFWDGSSRGTLSSIKIARQQRKPLTIYYSDGRIEKENQS